MTDSGTQPDRLLQTRALKRSAPVPAAGGTDAAGTPASQVVVPADVPLCKADITRDDLTGLSLGQYALGRKIGGGGMGKVFAARHLRLDRALAIKFLSTDLSQSHDARLRFEQEVQALGKLQHPNIVNAVDAGCINDVMYLVMDLIEGEDLTHLIRRRGALTVAEGCELVRQAALGLAYSHGHGFVHRDIKPSNLIVDRGGNVVIVDFGLVRSLRVDTQLTENGEMLGTWDFLAPEQAHDASDVDSRCDIYSLGCTLIYLLSGSVPFGGECYATPAAKLKGHLFDRCPWLDQLPARFPQDLAQVIERLLAKSPGDRYSSAEEVAAALDPFTATTCRPVTPVYVGSRSRHRMWVPPGIVIACGMAVGGGLFLLRESPTEARTPSPVPASFKPFSSNTIPVAQDLEASGPANSQDIAESPAAPVSEQLLSEEPSAQEAEAMSDTEEVFVEPPVLVTTPSRQDQPRRKTLAPQAARNAAVNFSVPLVPNQNSTTAKANGR